MNWVFVLIGQYHLEYNYFGVNVILKRIQFIQDCDMIVNHIDSANIKYFDHKSNKNIHSDHKFLNGAFYSVYN